MGALACAAPAAATPFTWTGLGATPSFSNPSNWNTAAPLSDATSLTFGALSPPCGQPSSLTCYSATNDVSGVNVSSISIDTSEQYYIQGAPVMLGAGGVTAAPTTAEPGSATFSTPLALTASQGWSVNGGLSVGQINGDGHSLSVRFLNPTFGQFGASTLFLSGHTETSSFTAAGDGIVEIVSGGDLNAGGAPVALSGQTQLWPVVSASIGALSTGPGTGLLLTGNVAGSPATLTVEGTASIAGNVIVGLFGAGGASELVAQRVVARGEFVLYLEGTSNHEVCPALNVGQSYVLVSSTQPITGQFAPNGSTLPIDRECSGLPLHDLALVSDTAHAVRATVIATPALPPIHAWLRRILRPSGKHASIAQIVAHGGYEFVSTPPAPGVVNVEWSTISKHKPVFVAIGSRVVGRGKTSLRISLTRAGRRLLRRSSKLRVTASAAFAYPMVGARDTFTLK